jgi:uncharacterized protein (DUF736 family)
MKKKNNEFKVNLGSIYYELQKAWIVTTEKDSNYLFLETVDDPFFKVSH